VEEAEALSRELENSPESRRRYLRIAGLHAALAAEESPQSDERAAVVTTFRAWWQRPLPWVAALAVTAAVGLLAWRGLSALRLGAAVAQVGRLENARWVAPETRLQPGDALRAGQVLELSAGTAVVEFTSGARVTLIGPSIFELSSGNGGFLSIGQLKALADTPESKGFTVRTRTARVVDIGTEFVAAAAPDGQSRIDVTRGEVQVHVAGAQVPQRLRTGEALSVEAGRQPVLVRIEPGDGTAEFRFPTIPPPSHEDYADQSQGRATMKVVRGGLFLTAPVPSGSPDLLLDGRGQTAPDSPAESVFFGPNDSGALLLDLGRAITISQINTYSWHQNRALDNRVRAVQKFTLFGFAGDDPPQADAQPAEAGWVPIARVDSDDFFRVAQPIDRPAQQACSITGAHGAVGRYRYLLWVVEPTQSVTRPVLDNTFYAEFDVYGRP
jgi:hypothetical protein